jgi:hypothetical protein
MGETRHNIKVDFKETEFDNLDWIYLAQEEGLVVAPCEYVNEHQTFIKWKFD